MINSFSEFKFYQAFRVPVEKADGLRFIVETEDEMGKTKSVDDGSLVDVSVGGLGFSTQERLLVGAELRISMQFKKMYLDRYPNRHLFIRKEENGKKGID